MIETINLAISIIILILGISILSTLRKVDINLLKAKLFLHPKIFNKLTFYATLCGGFFILYEVAVASEYFFRLGLPALNKIARTAFSITFLLLTYQWYDVLKVSKKT